MKFYYLFLSIVLFNFHSLVLLGQVSQQDPLTPLSFARQDSFYSEALNENRKMNIYLPESFHEVSDDHTYPVLLLLEDEFFYMVSGVVKHLSSVERMPETIVVSILDMSYVPTVHTNGSTFWPTEKLADQNPDPFTKHLKEELFPYLKSKYRANDFRIIMGLSFTSVYVHHTFVNEPGLFDAHIAIASGDILGMGYKEGERFIDLIAGEVKNHPGRKNYLYVTSADGDGGGNSPEIGENLMELDSILSPLESENFKYISKLFPDEGHYDVALPALIEALGMVFPKKEWFARYRNIVNQPGNAMHNIDKYYERLSKKYGFRILPRAERWNSGNRLSLIGPYLIKQKRVAEGIEILERCVELRPNSPDSFYDLAKAYENDNQIEKAVVTLSKAYELSRQLKLPGSEQYLDHLEKLKKNADKQ
ncbi:alpha/beta hydrolase [Sinomicrobium weinanense]|uniref:Tetratricopeptide repeat protein n=1 Tax=Sinomicrobium weinanense TaxID=2842200 RepID=A0A926JV11_9FLAO|nr:alpha/beta hydrolase-fold protein [Sinomicrobium weinanense]MBC9798090.1 tetratricopeptide repeat protein [Sinomicrobium weinanense]MBU3122548.1 tetratricopeptide repeat protein [Sinomicrobium weinanense]